MLDLLSQRLSLNKGIQVRVIVWEALGYTLVRGKNFKANWSSWDQSITTTTQVEKKPKLCFDYHCGTYEILGMKLAIYPYKLEQKKIKLSWVKWRVMLKYKETENVLYLTHFNRRICWIPQVVLGRPRDILLFLQYSFFQWPHIYGKWYWFSIYNGDILFPYKEVFSSRSV